MRPRNLLLAPLCLLVACTSSPRAASPAATVLDSLVAGLQLGARAAPMAAAHHLPFSPYVGYADTGFRTPAGVHGLVLQVDEALRSESERPTRWANVERIGIGFVTHAAADSARQLLMRHLGSPVCYFVGDEARRVEWYYWPEQADKGILLTLPLLPYQPAYVVFGAPAPDPKHTMASACDAG